MLIIDSKSIRSSEYFERKFYGNDGHKKIRGIKLCACVDRLKRCWRVAGIKANQSEHKGVKIVLDGTVYSAIKPNSMIVIGDRYFDSDPLKKRSL